jgi:hypothetical protein
MLLASLVVRVVEHGLDQPGLGPGPGPEPELEATAAAACSGGARAPCAHFPLLPPAPPSAPRLSRGGPCGTRQRGGSGRNSGWGSGGGLGSCSLAAAGCWKAGGALLQHHGQHHQLLRLAAAAAGLLAGAALAEGESEVRGAAGAARGGGGRRAQIGGGGRGAEGAARHRAQHQRIIHSSSSIFSCINYIIIFVTSLFSSISPAVTAHGRLPALARARAPSALPPVPAQFNSPSSFSLLP